jgi:hypothetical protein
LEGREESSDSGRERERSSLATIPTTKNIKIGVNEFHKVRRVLWDSIYFFRHHWKWKPHPLKACLRTRCKPRSLKFWKKKIEFFFYVFRSFCLSVINFFFVFFN